MMDNDDSDEDIDDNLEANEEDEDSVSDFDDDEDPDKIDIPVASDLAVGGSSSIGSSATSVNPTLTPKPSVPVNRPVRPLMAGPVTPAGPIKSSYMNGKPMVSSLGLPILPVNTATTRVGGPTVARRGGYAGQPFTSECSELSIPDSVF